MFIYGVCHPSVTRTNQFEWKGPADRGSYVLVAQNGSTFSAKNPSLNITKPHKLKKGVYNFQYNDK